MKQSIKLFLIPDYKKTLLTLVLTGLSLFFVSYTTSLPDPQPDEFGRITIISDWDITVGRGLPLFYLMTHTGFGADDGHPIFIFYPGLIINLIFWYFVSCLIIFLYNKLKNKKVQLQKK